MPTPTRRLMIFRGLAGGAAAAIASAVAWVRPAEAAEEAGETAGPVLAKTSGIPVGGGRIINGKWVVTQPVKGTFRAFSAKCTHQGCPVSTIRGGTINCPCHGSRFRIADGSVARGPATRPLARRKIKVSKGVIRLG
ncbi:Rieske (2Fe-2S) protein [Streptosporangium sp. NBC_01755]|uniref:Rieske (2Fe-2S) protein n=1 Tax=unclassified Streptosporangium TaxID=2632669 RepID=UPI002DDBBACA|nr:MULTISPECIES: Rieske (2Fe-2S) protein [unclassified Streptosporangium]WSA25205.1 Rieske (2Fe-2S) protein [Streptosporangium sp. NBC_01810]WSD03455.1 Rieske (2Fe-2S) protein [Streptosporangium sp. NBC_01755]